MDQSGSINSTDYNIMKTFIVDLIKSFKVSKELVHIGLAQFSSTFQHQFYLNQFFSEEALIKQVVDLWNLGGGTNIGVALHSIREYFEAAHGSRRLEGISQNLVLITDGDSNDTVEEGALLLRNMGVEVFSIGVGNIHDLELLQIAGRPDRVFTVNNFGSLVKIKEKVVDTICKSKPIINGSGE